MSTQTIVNAVVHNLIKSQGSREVKTELRSAPLVVKPALERLILAVHDAYASRAGKSHGAFEADTALHPAQLSIRELLSDDGHEPARFIGITQTLMSILADRASSESLALGGYVLMVDLNNGSTRWLLMAVLTDVAGAAINESLDVVDATHLDLSAMRFAGRVNLTDLAENTERCIGFLRGKKTEVSGYFERFIGVSTIIRELQETQRLVQVIKQFASEQKLDELTRERLLNEVYRIGDECSKTKSPLDLNALANRVWSSDPDALKTAIGRADPPISDGFVPDRRALLPLKKFKAKTSTWTLEFDRSAMADNTIHFDPKTRELKISRIPDEIAARLTDEFTNDEAP